jgi:putative thioredoxin
MSLSLAASAPVPAADGLIKDVDLATFMKDVIEASKQNLIIADFWASWSAPCKQLIPVLEKLVRSYKGAVRLAKLDVDRNPEIAQQMGVDSVPAVFAFYQGRPVDGFMGALPEPQIKSWIDQLIHTTGAPAAAEDDSFNAASALKQATEFLSADNIPLAQAVYADVLDAEPGNAEAFAGLLRCLMLQNQIAEAKEMLAKATPELAKHKALDAVRTMIDLARQAEQSVGTEAELENKLAKNPADHQARFDLATAFYATGRKEEAVDHLLDIVRRDRKWNDEAARKQLVKLFEALGPVDPLTISARKRLSSILFA